MSELSGYLLLSDLAYATGTNTTYKGLYRKGPEFKYPYPKGNLGKVLKYYDNSIDENGVLHDVSVARKIQHQFLRAGVNYDLIFFCPIERKEPFSVCRPPRPCKFLGYDVCWAGGSFYSIVYDELVYGLIHGKKDDTWMQTLRGFSGDLNNYLLFDDVVKGTMFLEEYMKATYPEREDGPFYIWMVWQLL